MADAHDAPRAGIGALHDALDAVILLVADDATAVAWDGPSVLPELTVGALCGHLYLAARRTRHRLDQAAAPRTSSVMGVGEYYVAARLADDGDLSAPRPAQVREDGGHVAARGHAVVVDRFRALRAVLLDRLTAGELDRLVVVETGRAVSFGDFLDTRTTELVVHGDDLASSIGCATAPGPDALAVAIGVLLAVVRHQSGDAAVVRALARPGRAAPGVLRAL